jgi:hypothetical protein
VSDTNDEPTFCATCRTGLIVYSDEVTGRVVGHKHKAELRDESVDHPAAPVPISQIPDPIQECDFCSMVGVVWIYLSGDYQTQHRRISRRYISQSKVDKGWAAPALRSETEKGPTNNWGDRWGACTACTELIEARDTPKLVTRVVECLPRYMTSTNARLLRVRGDLYDTYDNFFANLQPGRGRVEPGHPMGIWEGEQ